MFGIAIASRRTAVVIIATTMAAVAACATMTTLVLLMMFSLSPVIQIRRIGILSFQIAHFGEHRSPASEVGEHEEEGEGLEDPGFK